MRIITWNLRRATEKRLGVWEYLVKKLSPDIALLQDVWGIHPRIDEIFDRMPSNINQTGKKQKFNSLILVKKGMIVKDLPLRSEYEWVNQIREEYYKGYFTSCIVQQQNEKPIKVISVYNPWKYMDKKRLEGIDKFQLEQVRLKAKKTRIWGSEIIWWTIKNMISGNEIWVVGGDYNSSETFDKDYKPAHGKGAGRSSGNKEILDRMRDLGFTECLRGRSDKITPTYRNPHGQLDHQIDHLFVTDDLYSKKQMCKVGKESDIFNKLIDGKVLSDHLPIIADF